MPKVLTQGNARITLSEKSRVRYIGSRSPRSGALEKEIDPAVSICILPCGATRRAGSEIKLPKCVVLTAHGYLHVVDTDAGDSIVISKDVEQVLTHSWDSIQRPSGKRYLSHSGIHKTRINLPSAVLFTVWICDSSGLRLWLPALDDHGEVLNTRCAHF